MSCVKMEAKYSLKVLAMSMLFSAYDLLFPFPSFNCLDTFPGMCETFDFNLKNDQNRFGLCLREVQIELMFPCGFHIDLIIKQDGGRPAPFVFQYFRN